jgi:hypothetical protein
MVEVRYSPEAVRTDGYRVCFGRALSGVVTITESAGNSRGKDQACQAVVR